MGAGGGDSRLRGGSAVILMCDTCMVLVLLSRGCSGEHFFPSAFLGVSAFEAAPWNSYSTLNYLFLSLADHSPVLPIPSHWGGAPFVLLGVLSVLSYCCSLYFLIACSLSCLIAALCLVLLRALCLVLLLLFVLSHCCSLSCLIAAHCLPNCCILTPGCCSLSCLIVVLTVCPIAAL
jgi:hypothetical protein